MDTMKALVKKYRRPGLWLDEVPIPAIGKNDVLVKVIKTSICGTDVHIYDWDQWAEATIPVPMVIGHEFVGRIAAMGENVSGFEVGDLVSAEGTWFVGDVGTAGRAPPSVQQNLGSSVNRPGVFEYVAIPRPMCGYAIPTSI